MKAVAFVGMFPPPVHGMAAVNEYLTSALRGRGLVVETLDLSPGVLSWTSTAAGRKLWRVMKGLARLAASAARGRVMVLYMGVSGGKGQVYEVLFLCVARLFRLRCFLHHHSFAYIDRWSAVARLALGVAGKQTIHVLLCEKMRAGLEQTYGRTFRTLVVSNFAFFSDASVAHVRVRSHCRTVGFLSNISREKGIMLFLELVRRTRALGLPLRFVIAGPFADCVVARSVGQVVAENRDVEYLGPVYGDAKQAFLEEIDVLAFPSRYVHEAEPVTVIEALSQGIPVVSTARGCLPSMVPADCGRTVHAESEFVEIALDQLRLWVQEGGAFPQAAVAASQWARRSQLQAQVALDQLGLEVAATYSRC